MAGGDGLRAGPGRNLGVFPGTKTPFFWYVDRGVYVPENHLSLYPTPFHYVPQSSVLIPRYPARPLRTGRREGTGATPPLTRSLSHGQRPRWCLCPSLVGEVAPVRFIPAGRLGSGPKPEAGSAGTGAGAWSQNWRRC